MPSTPPCKFDNIAVICQASSSVTRMNLNNLNDGETEKTHPTNNIYSGKCMILIKRYYLYTPYYGGTCS